MGRLDRHGSWWEENGMRIFRCLLPALIVCSPIAALVAQGVPRALPAAHAHNDYLHKRPLLDALAQGFCSVEADIFLVDGALLVAHELSLIHI